MSDMRDSVVASWRAARRAADATGVLRLNAASAAGMLLERASGDAEKALEMAAEEWQRWGWYEAVAERLGRVLAEETQLVPRARRVGGA